MSEILPETITIRKGNSTATAYLFGATLTSWKPNGSEVLFVSEKAHFDNQRPIRGGIPVVFHEKKAKEPQLDETNGANNGEGETPKKPTIKKEKVPLNYKELKWWDTELTSLRNLTRRLRRRYQTSKDPVEREARLKLYKKNAAVYKRRIKSRKAQFGPSDQGPQHGFARRMKWSIKEPLPGNDSEAVTFVLEDSEHSRKFWNYKFRIEYTVTIVSDSQLKMEAVIMNKDENSFRFSFLLHSYFAVPSAVNCTISGLHGCNYTDKVNSGLLTVEKNEQVKLSEFTDRIYQKTPDVVKISHASAGREITIEKTNLPDTVVWNPWSENAKKLEDFGDDEWRCMLCVEAGYVSTPVTLKPGESFQASQLLSVN